VCACVKLAHAVQSIFVPILPLGWCVDVCVCVKLAGAAQPILNACHVNCKAENCDDGMTPALQALGNVMAGDDLAAMLTGMRSGESAELRCENGTFELDCNR
jgi:hypothetical protein